MCCRPRTAVAPPVAPPAAAAEAAARQKRRAAAARAWPVAACTHPQIKSALELFITRATPLSRTRKKNNPKKVAAARGRAPALRIQNLRVNNIEIPNSKRVEISLQYIYGIGQTTAKSILRDTGVENKKTYELNEEEINKLREEVGKYTTEADLVSCVVVVCFCLVLCGPHAVRWWRARRRSARCADLVVLC